MKKNIISTVVIFLILSMIFITIPYKEIFVSAAEIDTSDAALKKLENDLAKVKQKQTEIEKKIATAQEDLKNEREQKQMLDKKIEYAEESIELKDKLIIEYQNKIRQNEEAIRELEGDVSDQYNMMLDQLKRFREEGTVNHLEVILGARNFSEFIMSVERVSNLLNYEQKNMERMNQDVTKLNELKAENENNKLRVEEEQKDLENEKAQTLIDRENAIKLINQFLSEENKGKADLAQLKKDEEAFNKYVEDLLAERERQKELAKLKNRYTGGLFKWPVEEKYSSADNITSIYGYRSFDKAWHTGIDIRVGYGTAIYAVADGTVVVATSHSSYGNFIIIDHGSNENGESISTLYAHNSKLLVKADQEVTAGTKIANAGSTGVSTGNHLHFEIRINGKHVDPLSNDYFKQYKP